MELRRDMWEMIRKLRDNGVTIILTTHYIEEAEDMADRVGVIQRGELILVEEKHDLMEKLGKKQLSLQLVEPIEQIPPALSGYSLSLSEDGMQLTYQYDHQGDQAAIARLLRSLSEEGLDYRDLHTSQSSLEDIFVSLVEEKV